MKTNRFTLKLLAVMSTAALLFPFPNGAAHGESLNPEGVNPHVVTPKKRIDIERKMAAAGARKKKQEEIAARKEGKQSPPATTNQGATPADSASKLED